jgi:hypothetical protein
MKTNVIVQKIQKKAHIPIAIWFLTDEYKPYVAEKSSSYTNGARKTEYPHVKTETRSQFLTLY